MNISETEYNEVLQIQQTVAIIVPIFFGLIALTGFIGNCLVIIVVLINPQMRSTTNLLIANLAIADLLFVIFCIPFTATDYITTVWPFGNVWCKIVQYLIVVTANASIYTLVLMSFDRFLAVVYPISSKTIRTGRITIITILCLWLGILIVSVPVAFVHGLAEFNIFNQDFLACQFLDNNFLSWSTFHITFMAISYFLPLLLISALYLKMIIRLWHTGVTSPKCVSNESQRGRKRVTRLVIIIVVAFASLWFPIQVILVLKSLDLYEIKTVFKLTIQIIAQILAYTSSCINPLLYAFLSDNFRKAFRKIMNCSTKYNAYNNCHEIIEAPRRTSYAGTCSTAI